MWRPFLLVAIFFLSFGLLHAETAEELRAKIEAQSKEIEKLTQEIEVIQTNLNNTSKDRQTLQGTVKSLDLSLQKMSTDIRLTEARIGQKDTEIAGLAENIDLTSDKIGNEREVLMASIRELDSVEESGIAVAMLSGENLGAFFSTAATYASIREALRGHIVSLGELKEGLQTSKSSAEKKRTELALLKRDLADQKIILDGQRAEKNKLLKDTQNKESEYQKLLDNKLAQKAQFETDLREFENALRITIDPSSIPRYGSGVLSWPLQNVLITQHFGNTSFSTKNPQVYNGNGHNGIDLRASVGTKLLAARSGIVKGTGNTDLTCKNASYGQWILIEHDNGLSTLYAHLSYIRVKEGERVGTGELIGYTGNTGYSTGPHLHFTVYATQGVRIQDFPSKAAACKGKIYHMPVADPKAYLNPLSYL